MAPIARQHAAVFEQPDPQALGSRDPRTVDQARHLWGHLLEIAYFSLGRIHMEQGQEKQALEAFESCLTANEENPYPNGSRLKKAREYIVQIKGE